MTGAVGHEEVPAALAWLQALRQPAQALVWPLADWSRVVRLGRRLRLLARLAESLEGAGLLQQVPLPPRRHLVAELRLSRCRMAAMGWALERIGAVLIDAPYPRVLLKGAAYLGQELPLAAGRLPSDLDILVPQHRLADAQERLLGAGWSERALDAHDRRYYHEWSHEVPPMVHPLHALELDLHHNILPPLARTNVDARRLLATLMPSRWPGWQVLAPVDQVLHAAAHLFLDPELDDRLRDLVDLDGLMRHFAAIDPGFWLRLSARAADLGLQQPLALACHFTVQWLGTPVPESVRDRLPASLHGCWMQALAARVLLPLEPEAGAGLARPLAAAALLANHHLQRLPLRLLVPHLWHKLRMQRSGRAAPPAAVDGPA